MRSVTLASVLLLLIPAGWCLAETPQLPPINDQAQIDRDPVPSAAAESSIPSSAVESQAVPRFWARAEYLLWKVQSASVPALVGTIPVESAELVQRLSDSTITPVYGGSAGSIAYGAQSGYRLTAGLWLDADQQLCVDAGFFQLQPGHQRGLFQSAAAEPLGVLFNDPVAGHNVLIMDAVPGLRVGSVGIEASNRLWGAEANVMARLPLASFPGELSLLGGFRHLQFDEGLSISTSSTSVPGGLLPCG
jgi:hypothetical protein